MDDFFKPQSQEDLQRRVAQRRINSGNIRDTNMDMSPMSGHDENLELSGFVGGDSLDDIIMQNNKELQRRQSYPYTNSGQAHDRMASMMEFGSNSNDLNRYQFDGSSSGQIPHQDTSRRTSIDDMNMTSNSPLQLALGGSSQGFGTPMHDSGGLSLDPSNAMRNMTPDMVSNLMGFSNTGLNTFSGDTSSMDMFSPNGYGNPFSSSSMQSMPAAFSMGVNQLERPRNSRTNSQRSMNGYEKNMELKSSGPELSMPSSKKSPSHGSFRSSRGPNGFDAPLGPGNQSHLIDEAAYESAMASQDMIMSGLPSTGKHGPDPNFAKIYSSSGFDMLGALMRVATRENPEINIGAVDMSCAFVVCDVTQNDCPIVYVSDIFERLTGYNKHEVLGRNCRFLQAPDGKVMPGIKRKYVDDESVHYLKNRISQQKEAQRSLINYRKGGQPFMNLLTMIPITWDSNKIKYFVGFQVDLVEQPGSVAGKGSGGSYTVNYSQGMLPRYVWQPPDGQRPQIDAGQTISRDEVSNVLSSLSSSSDSDFTKRQWDKVLLENTDDVVHVLSLKGLFLYLSPSCRQVLEYDSSELVGTALSSVCHPSDIVPVTRELKDTSNGATVNVVFRIRRKRSGYTWFESHGSLCVEQGKGKKCIILVGRERPVYALSRTDIGVAGGIGESELWTKLSTSGMFLFVSSNVRILLDRQPEDMIGTSIQAIMRDESKVEFGRSLERARTGKRVVFKHDFINKRGQLLHSQTTLYPGDASEGQKPTFLVAQTKLLKSSSRAVAPTLTHGTSSRSIGSAGLSDSIADDSNPASQASGRGSQHEGKSSSAIRTANSGQNMDTVLTQAGGSGLPIGTQDAALASEDNIFDELKTTRCTSWQFELRQMEKSNRVLSEELASLLSSKKKRKRRKGAGNIQRDCANCHTRVTPEWRRGPSGQRDLCNSCGLRWAKQNGRVSPRTSSRASVGDAASKHSTSPAHSSPLQNEMALKGHSTSNTPNLNPKPTNGTTEGNSPTQVKSSNLGIVAVPGSLGGRTTAESQPVHAPSQGFKDGGPNHITKIDEKEEPS